MPKSESEVDRRKFLTGVVSGGVLLAAGCEPRPGTQGVGATGPGPGPGWLPDWSATPDGGEPYEGPNVVIVRFGGGARRRETIDPQYTYSPFLCRDLAQRGVLFPRMMIDTEPHVETNHGQGTLYILTGKYERHQDIENGFLKNRFESTVPTLFEYLRKAYRVPEHQTLIVNGEDRTDEEFYTFSNHHLFGAHYRSNVLSLFRFKTYVLRRQIESGYFAGQELEAKRAELAKFEALDYRREGDAGYAVELAEFWEQWRLHYGESGLVNPRGDRLLTELAVRAFRQLRPRLMMINYNDCDYVHWGNVSHYTQAISIMDEGLKRLVETVEADPEYRDNTVFVVVPDCGRDSNPAMAVPFQHHFNSRSSREIFAVLLGPGIDRGRVVDKPVDQISIAATVGQIMGFDAAFADGSVLAEAFA